MYLQQKERQLLQSGQSNQSLKSVKMIDHSLDRSLVTAKKIPITLPLSSSLNMSPMTAAPITGPSEAPIDWKNLQNSSEGMLCAEATPAEPITNTGKVYR